MKPGPSLVSVELEASTVTITSAPASPSSFYFISSSIRVDFLLTVSCVGTKIVSDER